MKQQGFFFGKCISNGRAVFFLLMTVFIYAGVSSYALADWRVDCVDCDRDLEISYPRAIALDSMGRPHIAYGKDNLYHAYFDGTQWVVETVDNQPGVGSWASIAIDGDDGIHIAYPDNSAGSESSDAKAVKYATNTSGDWVVDSFSLSVHWWGSITYTSIAVDSQKKAHIAYFTNYDPERLGYLTNISGQWANQTVDTEPGRTIGHYCSIDIDSNDRVHIGYIDLTYNDHKLKYATNAGGGWSVETVDNIGANSKYVSLVLDGDNHAHISYQSVVSGGSYSWSAKYATNSSGSWSTETIEKYPDEPGAGSGVGEYSSMAVDTSGKFHIVYNGEGGIHHTSGHSGNWVVVQGPSSDQQNLSMAVDAQGFLHLSYKLDDSLDIVYSTNKNGTWVATDVDKPLITDVGWSPSLALDPSGVPHVTYYDATGETLKQAGIAGESWTLTTLWGVENPDSSLVVDANGHHHLVYVTSNAIMYATDSGGSWSHGEILSDSRSEWSTPALGLDLSGVPYVAFCDGGYMGWEPKLKYATKVNGQWNVETLASDDNEYSSVCLCLDANEKVHIVFSHRSSSFDNPTVVYMTNATGSWVEQTIGNGREPSLALDANGFAHVSYTMSERSKPITGPTQYYYDLGYATNLSGAWVKQTLAEETDDGGFTSSAIGIGTDMGLHICYGGYGTSLFKHAFSDNGNWLFETVDTSVSVDGRISLELDSGNYVHLAYYDGIKGDLKYATNALAGSCIYYRDVDEDGYGNPDDFIQAACGTPPAGYVVNSTDCDDTDAAINPALVWYLDADADGYSDGTTLQQCERPSGYKLISELEQSGVSGDCDDSDPDLNPNTIWYKDLDQDGYSDGIAQTQCPRPDGFRLPLELITTFGDCNDGDYDANPAAPSYCSQMKNPDTLDLDGDGTPDSRDEETRITGEVTLEPGEYVFKRLVFTDGSRISLASNPSATGFQGVKIHAAALSIGTGTSIVATGHPAGSGPGAGGASTQGGGGGGYGGIGGNSIGAAGGVIYGFESQPDDLGSGGGAGNNPGGAGGGAIWFVIDGEFLNNGEVNVDGEPGETDGGGGSGGSIHVLASRLTGTGVFSAKGGISQTGGGGGGGRIALYAQTNEFQGTIDVSKGTGAEPGQPGTAVQNTQGSMTAADLTESAVSADTVLFETVVHRSLNLQNATVSGAFSGQMSFTRLDAFAITTGSFAGKQIWRGTWTSTISGSYYTGQWQGVAIYSKQENKYLLKASLSGQVSGVAEGVWTESSTGSGVFDQCEMDWTINRLGDLATYAILKVNGTLNSIDVQSYEQTELFVLQTTMTGASVGDYAGPLQSVLTLLRVVSQDRPCYGEGFGFLSYTASAGTGQAWAHAGLIGDSITELSGLATGPMKGKIHLLLYDTQERGFLLTTERLDGALPAMCDLKVETWGPKVMSSGQTEDYIIEYRNDGIANAQNVVVVDRLPHLAEYRGCSPGGMYRWDTHEVIWKLGTLPPGAKGYLSASIRIPFATALGTEFENTAKIATTSLEQDAYLDPEWKAPFDVEKYLAFVPTQISSVRLLTGEEGEAVLSEENYKNAIQYAQKLGLIRSGSAVQVTTNKADTLTFALLSNPGDQGELALATKMSSSGNEKAYIIQNKGDMVYFYDQGGGMSFKQSDDIPSDGTFGTVNYWGDWSPHSCPSTTQCVANCIWSVAPGLAVGYLGGKLIEGISNLGSLLWGSASYADAALCFSGYTGSCIDGQLTDDMKNLADSCSRSSTDYCWSTAEDAPAANCPSQFFEDCMGSDFEAYNGIRSECNNEAMNNICKDKFESAGVSVGNALTGALTDLPLVDILAALTKCILECKNDMASHTCTPGESRFHCASWWDKTYYGYDVIELVCDEVNCMWGSMWGAAPWKKRHNCEEDERCVDAPNAGSLKDVCIPEEDVPEEDEAPSTTLTGHDPNYKARIDVAANTVMEAGECADAGETLRYRVEFENEGEGIAFGVYFTDTLDPYLDETTLDIGTVLRVCPEGADACIPDEEIGPAGIYDPESRTITWILYDEGRVDSMQGGYAEFTVNIKGDAADGTQIWNFATIYFASVPEVTPTNAVVTRVGPKPVWYLDNDKDGFGTPDTFIATCSPPEGYVDNCDDCNDGDPDRNPGTIWYRDSDDDGYSNGSATMECERPQGYKLGNELTGFDDCNDDLATANPGADEVCGDGVDNNCDGQIDEGCIQPQDCVVGEWSEWGECSVECGGGIQTRTRSIITEPANGGATCPDLMETRTCNSQDCPQTWYKDIDEDGYSDGVTLVQVICPDGYFPPSELIALAGDCNDAAANIHPDASEICGNGVDDNCDGSIDEGCGTVVVPGDLDGDGDVDRNDVTLITAHRNQSASVCPACDIDGDGKITVLDARKLMLMCTCSRCVCPD